MADEDDLPEQLRIRREKRAGVLNRGGQPYPVSVPRTASLLEIREKHKDLPIDVSTGIIESVTGRVIFKRDTGKLCFANLREGDGTELQAMFSLDKIGEDQLEIWKSEIDLGDIVSVTGEVITSKRGELSILANSFAFAAKALRPLPDLPIDVSTGIIESVTGRVIFKRDTGKLCFANLREGDGTELQAMFSLDKIGEDQLEIWKSEIDLGDIVSVTGEVITSKRGELSILANSFAFAAKALRPLPVEHKPLSEESRVRMRYVDLIVRPEARSNARLRPTVMRSLRNTFNSRNFLEVETPMLQVMHGGAAARPFKTFSNAYEMDLFLRIAPELYLKRCVVGGLEKVFEINRNFRNEGADSSHSP